MTEPRPTAVAGAMTLVYLVTAANNDATPEQRAELKVNAARLRDKSVSMRDIAQRVFDIMGPDWTPADEWLDAIEAISGRRFR